MGLITVRDKVLFIESVFGTGKLARNGKNFYVRCPICAPRDHSKKKLAILIEDDRCHCWSCGFKARTLVPLIRKYSSREKLIEYVERFKPFDRNHQLLIVDAEEPQKLALPKDFKLLVTARTQDPDMLAIRKYLALRHIEERDMWYFKLGYSDDPRWRRRVLVPSFNAEGELNYFVGRAIDKFRKPKYDNPDKDKLPIIFNELNIDWGQELTLVEGPFDLMKCPDNTVPLLGSDLNEKSALFNSIIAHGTPIVLALDGDMKVKKTPRIVRKLVEYDVSVRIARLPENSDPGQLSKCEVKQLIASAPTFSWLETLRDKLDSVARTSLSC